MPRKEIAEAFVNDVVTGDHVGAIRKWYAEGASMQENQAEPRVGRDVLMAHEAAALARVERVETELLSGPAVDGDTVVIHWHFTFVPKSGPPMSFEEFAWQEWQGDKIVRERFFYDPKQMRP